MIGYVRGYKIRNIHKKTKYLPNFIQSASSLHKHSEPSLNLEEEILNGAFANVLYKQGKLDGYYLIKKENINRSQYLPESKEDILIPCYVLIDKVLPKKIEEDVQDAVEEEILNSLKNDIAFHKVNGILWNDYFYTIDCLSPIKSSLWGVIIGILIGLLLWYFLKNLALSIIIGTLWALAMGSISFNSDLMKQEIHLVKKENAK